MKMSENELKEQEEKKRKIDIKTLIITILVILGILLLASHQLVFEGG